MFINEERLKVKAQGLGFVEAGVWMWPPLPSWRRKTKRPWSHPPGRGIKRVHSESYLSQMEKGGS